ncbi:MAG: histidine kinase [Ferruginibacter sp.]
MRKCVWLVLLQFLLHALTVDAQDAGLLKTKNLFPACFEVTDSLPDEFSIDISKNVVVCNPEAFEFYEKTGKLKYKQQELKPGGFEKPFFDPVNEITLLFSVSNATARQKIIYFVCGDGDLLKLVNLADTQRHIYTGGFLGVSNRFSRLAPNNYLPLKLPPESVSSFLFYAKFMGTYREKVIPVLLSEKTYQLNSFRDADQMRIQLVYHSFIIGGLFIISIFMFAQYFLNKDKAYLYYSAYGLCIFLLSEKIMELNCNINLLSYFFPYYVFYSHVILQLLASFFYIGFLKRLLGFSASTKAVFRYSKIVQQMILTGCVLYCVTFFLDEQSAFTNIIYNYGALISTLVMLPLLVLLFLLKRKDPAIRFFLTGFSIVVVAALTVVYINRSGLYTKLGQLHPVAIIELGFFLEMIFFGLALGYKTHRQKLEKESIQQQKNETEIAALKAQMNPHFIFNCINSIDAFIHTNDKYNATLYLNKFAKLLRNILDSSKQNTVAFSKDVETLRLYIELEELRHENKFRTKTDIDNELLNSDYKVPPLIIQPFVENAILHGLKNREDDKGLLQVEIKKMADKISYSIKDNGIGRKAAGMTGQNKESSYGMQISNDRIKLFNKEENPSVEIIDLYEGEVAAGTEVKVLLNIL